MHACTDMYDCMLMCEGGDAGKVKQRSTVLIPAAEQF